MLDGEVGVAPDGAGAAGVTVGSGVAEGAGCAGADGVIAEPVVVPTDWRVAAVSGPGIGRTGEFCAVGVDVVVVDEWFNP